MALHDEIKQEQKKIKSMPLTGKISYIWDYYKIHIGVCIIILVAVIVFVRDWRKNSLPDYLNVVMINNILTYDQKDTDITDDYIRFADVDVERYKVSIDTSLQLNLERNDQLSMAAEQKLLVLFSSGKLDVMMAPKAVIDHYASQDVFYDISALLSEKELKGLVNAGYKLYYAKGADSTYPAGFYLNNSDYLKNLSDNGTVIPEDNAVLAVTSCMSHPDAVLQLIRMITQSPGISTPS